MSYQATVLNVMIATPGDVQAERQIVRDVIHEWNVINAALRRVVLMPVGWDSHAYPAMGERPQAVINKQVLADCDLLVAIFWTRLGSPTGEEASGTVEEIREHTDAGKPTMIYFSQEPVRADSVDDAQYRALVEFRGECEGKGLVQPYDSRADFKDLFRRQISQAVNMRKSLGELEISFADVRRDREPPLPRLSDSARNLLTEAANGLDGTVMRLRTMGGLAIQTNSRNFVEDRTPRTEALWEGAVQELVNAELIADVGHKGEVFRVTQRGYEVADQLRAGL